MLAHVCVRAYFNVLVFCLLILPNCTTIGNKYAFDNVHFFCIQKRFWSNGVAKKEKKQSNLAVLLLKLAQKCKILQKISKKLKINEKNY